jgi:hypothetical protein
MVRGDGAAGTFQLSHYAPNREACSWPRDPPDRTGVGALPSVLQLFIALAMLKPDVITTKYEGREYSTSTNSFLFHFFPLSLSTPPRSHLKKRKQTNQLQIPKVHTNSENNPRSGRHLSPDTKNFGPMCLYGVVLH